MNRNYLLIALLFYGLFISTTLSAQPISQRTHINFDENWKFSLGHAADATKDFNFKIANIFSKSGKAEKTAIDMRFNDSSWRTVQLPHDWAVELPFEKSDNPDVLSHGYKPVGGLYPQNSIGWYRKHFRISRSDSGRRFEIQFDGIFRDSKIWINGFYLGNNESGYCGVSYDITDYLHYDRDNVIVVRADASQYEGWFYEGAGIYRHVWLNSYNNLHFASDGIFAYSTVQNNTATITLETKVVNRNAAPVTGTVTGYVTDRAGRVVVRGLVQNVSLKAHETKTVKQQLIVRQPILWSTETPYLYRIVPVITSGNKTTDSQTIRFGIRTIKIDATGLYVNGRYTKVKGVNCHQDHAGVGSALPDYLQYYRIRKLKELGVNAYRTSHNAPTPELLDACDSIGMLVLDEHRLLNSSPEYINQLDRLILRDRNRASVFLWSIGNEEQSVQTNSIGKRIAQTLLARQQELDPTRTSTYAADVANVFKGVNEVIPVRGFNYRIAGVDPYHKDHPQQPVLGTEMGSTVTTRGIYVKDSVVGYVPDQDITAPWWANTAEQWWTLAADRPWWMGGFIWTGFDYRGEPTPFEWPNINSHFGVMDMCGFPKNIYYYYQSWFTNEDVLHISPHWNPAKDGTGWKQGAPVNVWVNSNADNVELFLNGKSVGKKDMPRNRHLEWNIPFEPGVLEAVAYKQGRKITSRVETTGPAYEIVVSPSKTTMLADGADACVINITVTDKQGREVPDANDLIKFTITGDMKIIGVGNGDPSSHEPDKCSDGNWQRHLFNGKCQVIVQAGKKTDVVKFEATATGLFPGSTDIHTVQAGAPNAVPAAAYPVIPKPLSKHVDKMLGADISFLPELEEKGIKFSDKGVQKDALQILKDHGFNYIRLRIFNDPAADSGYSPKKGFCDVAHTLQMAKRIKNAGMKFLLDFHYSDYWADPGKQFKPAAWRNKDMLQLERSVYEYTKQVMQQLKAQGTLPDMVQPGNEINHGMIWPDGLICYPDNLARLVYAGMVAVKEVSPATATMLHMALGGQNDECHFFLDNMIARGVPFDVIGLSYYPKWHGTLADLKQNANDLATHYGKDIIIVEYSQLKNEVNEIGFNLPNGKGRGTCIWEPLNTWEAIFDKDGKSNDYLLMYDEISKKFMRKEK